MNGLAVQNKIANVLRRLNATARVVYFRSVDASGGNATLGLDRIVINTDTEIDPQPAVEVLTVEEVAAAGGKLQLGDYRLTMAGTVDEVTLQTNDIMYGTDVLKIIDYRPHALAGVVISWTVIARTVKA
jgi:hypothetical protein